MSSRADAALNSVVASLAREGGLPSTLWAGPEIIGRAVKRGDYPVEPTAQKKPASLKLGFAADPYSYSIDLGYPPPPPPTTLFNLDPEIKRECIWHGDVYRRAAALEYPAGLAREAFLGEQNLAEPAVLEEVRQLLEDHERVRAAAPQPAEALPQARHSWDPRSQNGPA